MQKLNKDQIEKVSGGVVQCQCNFQGASSGLVHLDNSRACRVLCCDKKAAKAYTVFSATPTKRHKYPKIASGVCGVEASQDYEKELIRGFVIVDFGLSV